MGSKKTTSTTNKVEDQQSYGTQTKTPFTSDFMKQNYNEFLGNAKNNYAQTMKNTNKLLNSFDQYAQTGSLGDDSYFKQAWGQAQDIDQSNLKRMNSADLNPYNDEVTRNYIDASNRAAYLANGQNINQMMGNMIRNNMANGSGHQTAAAKVGAQLAANINAQNQATYMARQNQLEQNALAANNQLGNFYNTLANIGIDYARLGQNDLNILLNAYNQIFDAQNNALNTYGNAVLMGSDPTSTSQSTAHINSKSTTENKQNSTFGDVLGGVLGAGTSLFTGFHR